MTASLITGARPIDGTGRAPVARGNLIVENGRILPGLVDAPTA